MSINDVLGPFALFEQNFGEKTATHDNITSSIELDTLVLSALTP